MKAINICKTYGDMWKKNENGYEINLKQIISGFSKEFIFEIEIPAIEHELSDINRNAEILEAQAQLFTVANKEEVAFESNLVVTLFN